MDNSEAIFKAARQKFLQAYKSLPTVMANEMVNFTKERFRQQNWLSGGAQPWKKRKINKDASRAILRKSGRLARSPRPITKGDMAGIGIDVPYAQVHNDGFAGIVNVKAHHRNKYGKKKVASGKFNKNGSERMKTVTGVTGIGDVKAHTRKVNIPRRRFVGPSATMMVRLQKTAQSHFNKFIQ